MEWKGYIFYYIIIIIIIDEYKDDSQAFIFTLKNPHGVAPTRFMKKKGSKKAIFCNPSSGPVFGNGASDILINDNNTKKSSCWICDSSELQYECHPKYKSSLFVNSAGPDEPNKFSVVNYEVYSFDICKEYVYNTCKYPDIIWNYIETKNISVDSLEMINNKQEIINDLSLIQCTDESIRMKISKCYLFNSPSSLLDDSKIIVHKYDHYLKKWIGDYNWRLIYRASKYGYTAESFHEYCDNVKGPTLVIIKSSEGWIFGGYTTQSWKVVHPDADGCIY